MRDEASSAVSGPDEVLELAHFVTTKPQKRQAQGWEVQVPYTSKLPRHAVDRHKKRLAPFVGPSGAGQVPRYCMRRYLAPISTPGTRVRTRLASQFISLKSLQRALSLPPLPSSRLSRPQSNSFIIHRVPGLPSRCFLSLSHSSLRPHVLPAALLPVHGFARVRGWLRPTAGGA